MTKIDKKYQKIAKFVHSQVTKPDRIYLVLSYSLHIIRIRVLGALETLENLATIFASNQERRAHL